MIVGLKGVVKLADERVRDLSLDFFLCDHEFYQAIVCLLLHALQSKILITTKVLYEKNLSVTTFS